MPAQIKLNASEIVARAHEAAGGENWVKPRSLKLVGYNVTYTPDGPTLYDKYAMWRIYADDKPDAHRAQGRVRIEGWAGDTLKLLLTYNGEATFTADGQMPPSDADKMWGSNFGFGAIRNALDEGWTQTRLPDDLVDGAPAYWVELTDPVGGVTRFAFAIEDYRLLAVGFDTPRGWHERRYSHYFSKEGVSWAQPGRVRLFYDGVKQNEIIWTDFVVGEDYPEDHFVVAERPTEPSF